jgi:hypothetical protein
MSLQSDTNNDIFIIPSQSLMLFSGSEGNPISLYVEPSGSVNFVGTTGSILKIMDNLSGSLFSVNNISGLSILEVFSDNQIKMGNPANYALVVSGSNVIITGSLVDKGTGVKFLVVDTATGVVHTTGSGGGGGSPTTPGGSPTQIQYNSASAFEGVPTLTYDGTILRATGSFTGSFTGNLTGTSSWADSASQAITASYINISSSNIATLEVSYATPGVIALLAKTGSGIPGGSPTQIQFNAGGNLFDGVNNSSYNNGTGQLTLGNVVATGSFTGSFTGSLLGTSSWATQSLTASYVNLVAGPRIQSIGYNGDVISITGSIGGSDTHIQFNSGSTFSGSSDLQWNYIDKSVKIRTTIPNGEYIVFNSPTGGTAQVGSIDYGSGFSTFGGLQIKGWRSAGNLSAATWNLGVLSPAVGANRDAQATFLFSSFVGSGSNNTTNATSSLRSPILAIEGRPGLDPTGYYVTGALSASFSHWANGFTRIGLRGGGNYQTVDQADINSSLLYVQGSIVSSGSTYTTSSAQGFQQNTAMYFGSPGAVGSWRIILSGSGATSTLNIERWNGSEYDQDTVFNP